MEHILKETRQILFSYPSKYFIETAYVCQSSLQLQLHNFFYEENWYFVAFIPRLIKHDFVAGKCLAEDFIADLEDF